jgi:hypothetical protein
MMIMQYIIIFVFIPLMGNSAKHNTYFCNSLYGQNRNSDCNYVYNNYWTWIYYIIYTLYFILGAVQIKYGENFMKLQADRKWTGFEKIELKIYKMAPFVFPIKTALDWSATKTSLQ